MAGPARLKVRLTPRANADRLDGWSLDPDGRPLLAARVRAAPVEGAANAALERLLAESLGCPRSKVSVERGASARVKTVEVEGMDVTDIERRLGKPLA
ncbi:MAG: DUF167 family protein [Caulobacteraceae bacterium]